MRFTARYGAIRFCDGKTRSPRILASCAKILGSIYFDGRGDYDEIFCIDIKIYTYIYKYITSVNNNNLLRALSRFVITSCYVEDLSMLLSNDCLPLIIDSPI